MLNISIIQVNTLVYLYIRDRMVKYFLEEVAIF